MEQSGNIFEVGFELYMQMLEEAVRNRKGEAVASPFRTPIFLKTDFFIPDEYINDEKQKIEFYKRFESCDSVEEVEQVEAELVDRFGAYPNEVRILIEIEKIRALATLMALDEIIEDSKSIRIKVSGKSKIDRVKIVSQLSKKNRLTIDPANRDTLVFTPESMQTEKKIAGLKKLLQQLL
jgi:transcription-repair coupling factor (superfamily II helicase)